MKPRLAIAARPRGLSIPRLSPALLALCAQVAGCTALSSPPQEKVLPSPVYVWTVASPSDADPGDAAASISHWRYVPLGATGKPFPPEAEFVELAERCRASAGASEAAEAPESCLGDRGFYRSQCSDGLDNDGDEFIDHPADPGCAEAFALTESPECNDKRDNDGDGLADWDGAGFSHPDPECADTPAGTREAAPHKSSLNPF